MALSTHNVDDFAIMPLGFPFEQWQPLTIASIHLGTLCIRQIRLSALEYHREIVVVGVSIHAIAVVGYQARDLPVFNRMGLLIHKLPELGYHACFHAKTSDRSIHDTFSLFSTLRVEQVEIHVRSLDDPS